MVTRDRPRMPAGYGVGDPQYGFEPIEWTWVERRLTEARNYWISTTRADGSPHAAPVWGVWVDDAFHFFTDPESLKGRTIARDGRTIVHLESGDDVVILEGTVEACPLTQEVDGAYESKYGFSDNSADDPIEMYRLRWTKALAWLESDFPRTATRWRRL